MKFDWRRITLSAELIFSLLFFTYSAISRSSLPVNYNKSLNKIAEYCVSQSADNTLSCQDFWYKTFNDPSVFWSFLYTFLTFILVCATVFTIFISLQNISSQRSDTQRLFVMDQRPWLKVELIPDANSIIFDKDGNLEMRISILKRNIGKSPAINVSSSQFISSRDSLTTFDRSRTILLTLRNQARQLMPVGRILLPEELDESNAIIRISNKEISDTWGTDKELSIHAVMYSVFYKSIFDERASFEVSMAFSFTFLGPLAPTPRTTQEMEDFRGRPRLQLMYPSVIT